LKSKLNHAFLKPNRIRIGSLKTEPNPNENIQSTASSGCMYCTWIGWHHHYWLLSNNIF